MNKTLLIVIAILAFGGAATMYSLGNSSGHMDELLDFWFYPIPLGVLAIIGLAAKKKTQEEQ